MSRNFNVNIRSCGVLLHPTSLPGPYGCGDIGPQANAFIDFVSAAGQTWWQTLPVNPPGPGNAPYSARSAFAGSPWLISLDRFAEQGLLQRRRLKPEKPLPDERVAYPRMMTWRLARLRDAFRSYCVSTKDHAPRLEAFARERAHWLPDYSLFAALHRSHKGRAWNTWPIGERTRQRKAMQAARSALADEIKFEIFLQFQFDVQWMELRDYAHQRGIGLIGDVPIFTAHDSSDVWANPALFELDSTGRPRLKSGVPPDLFSKDGQLWGHPLYRWADHRRTKYAWWTERLAAAMRWFALVRIDHFLGFRRLWAVPGDAKTARRGKWVHTPGEELLDRIIQTIGRHRIIAEDLGLVTPEAMALLNRYELPGMRILHWAFGGDDGARYHQPHNHPQNCVVYTGTHDNETALGWWQGLPELARKQAAAARRDKHGERLDESTSPWARMKSDRERFRYYVGSDAREVNWGMIRAAYQSPANLAIIPVQDVLGLGSEGRMNDPVTATGNWEWRMLSGALQPRHARRLKLLADAYSRVAPGH